MTRPTVVGSRGPTETPRPMRSIVEMLRMKLETNGIEPTIVALAMLRRRITLSIGEFLPTCIRATYVKQQSLHIDRSKRLVNSRCQRRRLPRNHAISGH